MSETRCTAYHVQSATAPEATGRVRYVQSDGREVLSGPLCDYHQSEGCKVLHPQERAGEVSGVGAVPLDYQKRPTKVRRELERRTEPELHPINLDPYPASVGEVADEIARYVLELEDSGVARGLLEALAVLIVAARQAREGY